MRVAVRRAAHQVLDVPHVLDDPIALPIIGPTAAAEMHASLATHQQGPSRAIRAFVVARSRVAEDELARAVGRGTTQYVVLGAGLDTFAYRSPYPESALRVFEVDHPATQAWKRRQLAAGEIAIPPSVTFAPVNFERETLADGLSRAGFDTRAPAFFSWLGVTMYLTEDAIDSTLRFIASTPHGGGLVFDYAVAKTSLGLRERVALGVLQLRVASVGEPFRTFFEPHALCDRLSAMGFQEVTDLGPDVLNARYFRDRADGLSVRGSLVRLMCVVV
jgi:methyltransferase (TIGR00027 family)